MKKILFLYSSIILMLLTACKKDNGVGLNEIVKGQIQFTIKDNVSLKQSFKSIKTTIGDKEYELRNFYYTKVIPPDSMTYYWQLFNSYSFIKVFNIFKKPSDNFTQFNAFDFKNLNEINYAKWDSIVFAEKLIEMPTGGENVLRAGFLFVPSGQEQLWITKLKGLTIINDADYIYNDVGPM